MSKQIWRSNSKSPRNGKYVIFTSGGMRFVGMKGTGGIHLCDYDGKITGTIPMRYISEWAYWDEVMALIAKNEDKEA